MYHRRIGWVTAAVSLICVPCSRALAQGERLQIHVAETHSLELSELMRIGSLDGPSDAFGRIRAVALDRSDRLYVADDLNHEVRVFEFDGQLVRIIGDRDNVTVRTELNIRRGFGGLTSAMFVLDIARDSDRHPTRFTFIGGGWGHGVGMCQNGATGMALDGYKYPAILAHYFSHTHLQRVYD